MVKYFLIYILAGQTSRYHKHQDNPVTQEWCANVRHRCTPFVILNTASDEIKQAAAAGLNFR